MAVTIRGTTPWQQEVAKTANYTVTAADSGTLFTTTGAAGSVTFTLPSLVNGVGCTFWFRNDVAQNMVITAPAGKLIIDGNAAATSATFSTASHQIGAHAMVYMNAAGTFYIFTNMSGPGNVVTVS